MRNETMWVSLLVMHKGAKQPTHYGCVSLRVELSKMRTWIYELLTISCQWDFSAAFSVQFQRTQTHSPTARGGCLLHYIFLALASVFVFEFVPARNAFACLPASCFIAVAKKHYDVVIKCKWISFRSSLDVRDDGVAKWRRCAAVDAVRKNTKMRRFTFLCT